VRLGKKRQGKRFQEFRRGVLVGNPRDPLIGFLTIVAAKTENGELTNRTLLREISNPRPRQMAVNPPDALAELPLHPGK
jgi:hypothetical protein